MFAQIWQDSDSSEDEEDDQDEDDLDKLGPKTSTSTVCICKMCRLVQPTQTSAVRQYINSHESSSLGIYTNVVIFQIPFGC